MSAGYHDDKTRSERFILTITPQNSVAPAAVRKVASSEAVRIDSRYTTGA